MPKEKNGYALNVQIHLRKISEETTKIINADPFYRFCCLCGSEQNVQRHHNLIFGGRQCDDWFTILPLCKNCHDIANRRDIRNQLNNIMIRRGGDLLKKYSKVKKYV